MLNKVRDRLCDYLEFDVDEIFQYGDPVIFGGAIRDSIADMSIHDVDILSGPESTKRLHNFVISKGYVFMENLLNKDINSIYSGIGVISEPYTYVKNSKIIQIIRPVASPNLMGTDPNSISKIGKYSTNKIIYKEVINLLIKNVDMSCCAVAYNGVEVYEEYPNSIIHCENKVFIHNKKGIMNSSRYFRRNAKLVERGWLEISQKDERSIILNHVLKEEY